MKNKSIQKLINATLITLFSLSVASNSQVLANGSEENGIEDNIKLFNAEDSVNKTISSVTAENVESRANWPLEGWRYTENYDYITLIYYQGDETSITIPGEYKGKPVIFKKQLRAIIPNKVKEVKFQTVNNQKVSYPSTSLNQVFGDLTNVTSLDLSGFDTSNVTDMSEMFLDSTGLTQLNLTGLNTSNVTTMSGMFKNVSSLRTLDLKSFNTSNVTDMSEMFFNSSGLTQLNLTGLNTSKVTTMSAMFQNVSSLPTLDLKSFNTSKVTDMSRMFYKMKTLKTLDLSSFDTSNVTTMNMMFDTMTSLTSLNIRSFNTGNVIDMTEMFCMMDSIKTLDLSHFDTSNVTDMRYMFQSSEALTSINLSSFNTSKVTNMSGMFKGTKSLKTIDIAHFDTRNVTDMSYMFSGASAFVSLDLSSFNTSKVRSMQRMFQETTSLKSLNLSSFKTPELTTMPYMFYNASALTSLDLSSFDTSQVTDMQSAFRGMTSLKSLQLEGFDTSNVTNMLRMFEDSGSLEVLDLTSFDLTKTSVRNDLFKCTNRASTSCKDLILVAKDPILIAENFNSDSRNVLKFSYNAESITTSTTTVKGKAPLNTVISLYGSNNQLIAETKVDQNNNYELRIPKQLAGTILELRLSQNGSILAKTKIEVLKEFNTFSFNLPSSSTTTLKGTGVAGSAIHVYTSKGMLLDSTTVDAKGSFQLTIPKQKAGKVLILKQLKKGYATLSKEVTVLNEFNTFTIQNPTVSSVAIYGTGEPGANVKAFVDGKAISTLTPVNSKGNYKITIPKQKAGTVVQVKQAKAGYVTLSKKITVLNNLKTFTTPIITTNTTAIYGTGIPGSTVRAYVNGKAISPKFIVNSKGNYKLTIPKQKAGIVVEIKQAKAGFLTLSKKINVLNNLKTFTTPTVTTQTTAIYGTGVPGATVRAYVNGKAISPKFIVNSKGNYKLTIPKQKAGTVVEIRQAKVGYVTLSKKVSVLNEIKTFTYSSVRSTSTTVSGKALVGSKVGIYTSAGKRLAIVNTDSKGNYKLTIPKQKVGTKLVIKQAKTGYATASKNITVIK